MITFLPCTEFEWIAKEVFESLHFRFREQVLWNSQFRTIVVKIQNHLSSFLAHSISMLYQQWVIDNDCQSKHIMLLLWTYCTTSTSHVIYQITSKRKRKQIFLTANAPLTISSLNSDAYCLKAVTFTDFKYNMFCLQELWTLLCWKWFGNVLVSQTVKRMIYSSLILWTFSKVILNIGWS